jgi:hypothetical protein
LAAAGDGGERKSTIDYALIASENSPAVVSFEIVEDWITLSDHRPITLTLGLSPALSSSSALTSSLPRMTWRTEYDEEMVESAVSAHLEDWRVERDRLLAAEQAGHCSSAEMVNGTASSFARCLTDALRESVGERERRPRSVSPFAFRCAAYDRLVARCQQSGNRLCAARRSGSASLIAARRASHTALIAKRKAMVRVLRARARENMVQRLEGLVSQPGRFWREHSALLYARSSTNIPGFVMSGGVLVSDPKQVLEHWRDSFASLFTPHSPTSTAAIAFQQLVDDTMHKPFDELDASLRGEPLLELERPLTASEVQIAVNRLRLNVSPGPDNIPALAFKHGGVMVRTCTLRLFNDILERGMWPDAWNDGLIHPLFKKGLRTEPLDYRGISLLPLHSQMLRSILNTRLSNALESRGLLSEFQCGFRARRGTYDHLLTLNEAALECWDRGTCMYMAFLDVTKAYDHTWRNGLWYRLRRLGVTDRVLRLWRSSYACVRRSVIVNDQITEPFECKSGVAQGAVDSPTLYDVFIDELASHLYSEGFGVIVAGGIRIPLLMYADDVVLMSESAQQLQRMLDAVARYAELWQFTYNISKSAVVVAGHVTSGVKAKARNHCWLLNGGRLPVPDHYTYLGIEFGLLGQGRWAPATSRLLNAARNRTRELLCVNGNKFGLNPLLQMRLWHAYCRSVLEYACPLWGVDLSADRASELETLQLRYAKSVLGVEWGTASAFVRGELGLRTLSSRRDELTLRLFGELLDFGDDRLVSRVIRARYLQSYDGDAKHSWCNKIKPLLHRYGLDSVWETGSTGVTSREQWSNTVHEAVKRVDHKEWRDEVASLSSLSFYSLLKHCPFAERYLECSTNREARLLKLQARSGTLALNARLSSVTRSPAHASCRMCAGAERWGRTDSIHSHSDTTPAETLHHFFFSCSFLQPLRDGLYARVLSSNLLSSYDLARHWFERASDSERLQWLLGGDMYQWSRKCAESVGGDFSPDNALLYSALTRCDLRDAISRHVQHFLLLGWRLRDHLNGGRVIAVRTDISGWAVHVNRPSTVISEHPPSASALATSTSSAALYSSLQMYAEIDPAQPAPRTSSLYTLVVEPLCAMQRSSSNSFKRRV